QALRRQGIATPQYLVELHGRLAYALALHMNRHSGTTLALSLTLLGGFVYVILPNVMLALGYHGRLPPVVAAWTANSLFGGGGV
ncbi:MAG: LptF/LptG family permease, partial [candidate division KSB1 bacterium]|nr:LptF/LptG family permease [candidate division KSB1 bacterium]